MPLNAGDRTTTCADCYFRRELLCALERTTVCPTFRAVNARSGSEVQPVAPMQAQLVPVAVDHMRVEEDSLPAVVRIAATATTPVQQAFDGFPDKELGTAPQSLRNAAADQTGASTLVIPVDSLADPTHDAIAGSDSTGATPSKVSGRVSMRVAQRYPNALQLC